jgi:hypothetical protein
MATFNDILKGEPDDGRGIPSDAYIKYQMDNMDRVEHTYEEPMDENMRVDLEHLIAEKLLINATNDDLESCYFETQKEWAETLPDDELTQTARDLGIDFGEK